MGWYVDGMLMVDGIAVDIFWNCMANKTLQHNILLSIKQLHAIVCKYYGDWEICQVCPCSVEQVTTAPKREQEALVIIQSLRRKHNLLKHAYLV